MKRFIPAVFIALLISGNLAAKIYTNKTFLMPRSHNTNIAMEYTTWHKQFAKIDDDMFGGTVQATGFYEKSNNKEDLGKYFGVKNYYSGSCADDFIAVVPNWVNSSNPKHTTAEFILHKNLAAAVNKQTLADKLIWRPYRESYGIRLDYHQKLDKILKGLFFKISVPIVHVKTSMGYSSSCCSTGKTSCATSCATDCSTSCTPKTPYCVKEKLQVDQSGNLVGTEYSLADYLTGCVTNTYAKVKQAALCKAKIHNGVDETGVADVDITLGYNFLYEPKKHLNVNVGLTIPVGSTPDGTYLFEPVVGNGGHWAIGAGVDSAFRIWTDEEMSLDMICACNMRYLFCSTEKRTMGFKWPNNSGADPGYPGFPVLYGHWLLGAKRGDTQVSPLANFLTQDVRVTPGCHFDGIIQFAFNYQAWTLDVGYNLFAKKQERVKLKYDACACADECSTKCANTCVSTKGWQDNTFGIADAWDTEEEFRPENGEHIFGNSIQRTDLCLDPCTQPSVVTHKIYSGLGYEFDEWDYPVMLGLGGSYEFSTDNDCLEAWSLWAKIGLTF